MKRKMIVVAVGVLAVGLLAGAAYGGMGMGRGMMRDPKKVDSFITWRITDALSDVNATEQQKQQILAIKDRLMPDVARLMQEKKAHHDEVKELWLKGNVSQTEVRARIDQRIEEMRAMAYKVADGALEAQKVLTPEQRAQLVERAEQMHKEGGGHGRWHQ